MYDPSEYAKVMPALKWVSMDLDDTLAVSIWPTPGIGEPIPEAIEECRRLRAEGKKIIVHTSRPWSDYENIERWLNDHEVPWDHIQCGKPLMAAYYDDRAYRPEWTKEKVT